MKFKASLLALVFLLGSFSAVLAQGDAPELSIRLNRDFGYGGFDNKIEGRFSIRVRDASGFEQVDFYIDDELIDSATEDPFNTQFRTENFSEGEHLIYAVGHTAVGDEVRSNEYTRVFISGAEVGQNVIGLILPLIGILLLAGLIATFLPRLIWGRKKYKIGDYGTAGGAICSRCEKPFGRHVMAPNMLVGKLERCPHCGKWQIARRASPPELEAAEERIREGGTSKVEMESKESEEERLKRQIDESRFD